MAPHGECVDYCYSCLFPEYIRSSFFIDYGCDLRFINDVSFSWIALGLRVGSPGRERYDLVVDKKTVAWGRPESYERVMGFS